MHGRADMRAPALRGVRQRFRTSLPFCLHEPLYAAAGVVDRPGSCRTETPTARRVAPRHRHWWILPTPGDTVYECGLDKRSSLASVQQEFFASHLTGKKPAVVIYHTDGRIGRYKHRIKVACERAGVAFYSVP